MKTIIYRINRIKNTRIISAYNRYFKRMGVHIECEAPYNSDLSLLIDQIKKNNIPGAFTIAFEHDSQLISLVDTQSDMSRKIGVVGFITNKNGIITGHAQGYIGMFSALKRHTELKGKKIVIMGGGNLARAFCYEIMRKHIPVAGIELYNRTIEHAKIIAKKYSCVKEVGPLSQLSSSRGDIFMNLSEVGAPWQKGNNYPFSEEFVKRFHLVMDANFVPLKTQLIATAEKMGVGISPGYETFTGQTAYGFEEMLGISVNTEILEEELIYEFGTLWK